MDQDLARFVHEENIKRFRRKLEAATDQAERERLLKFLAEEEAKVGEPPSRPTRMAS